MANPSSLQSDKRSAVADRLLDTKLVPPKGPRRIVARQRLIAELMEARRKRCVVLQGQGGCGKTTLLIAWRQALLPLGFDVAWLSLSPRDDELTRFLDCVLASLARIDPAITRDASLLVDPGLDTDTTERAIVALVRGIAAHPRDVVLVLDDTHYLGAPEVLASLQWLLDFSPSNFHLVLSSRGAAPLSLARLRSQDLVLELDMRELRFRADESQQFLEAQIGQIAQRDAQVLHELTDGWAAGLQLLSVDWKKRRERAGKGDAPGADLARVHLQDARGFTDYFEREVIAQLSPAELALLVSASTCNRFGAALCAALVGRPDAGGEAVALLSRLELDNLFITSVESTQGETWYRLHPLLRETLRLRFEQHSEPARRAVHDAALQWFRDHGYLDEAVDHALQAGHARVAAELVENAARSLSARGELRRLFGLLRQIPQQEIQAHIDLDLWATRLQLSARELDACAQSIARILPHAASLPTRHRFNLTLLRAALAVQRDDTEGAVAVLPEMLLEPEGLDAVSSGGRANLLSWLYLHLGDFERARQIQEETPPRMIDGVPLIGTASGTLQGRCLVGLSHALEGNMAKAEHVYGEVLHEAEGRGRSCVEPACLAASLLGEAFYERSDVAGVLRLLEARVDVLERVSIPDSVLRVMIVLAAAHWLEGRRLESFAYLERLEDYAVKLGLDRLLAHSLYEQMRRHLQMQDFEAAEAALRRIQGLHGKHPASHRGAGGEIALIGRRAQVLWGIAHADLEATAAQITPLIDACEARGDQRLKAQLELQLAIVEQRCGRQDNARRHLETALRLGHRLGLMRSLLDVDAGALDLMRTACTDPGFDPVLGFFAERLQAVAQADSPAPAAAALAAPAARRTAAGILESLSEREDEVMRLLVQAMSNKRIARILNVSPETVKWHLRNAYGKLGVTGRDDAVERFRDLEASREQTRS